MSTGTGVLLSFLTDRGKSAALIAACVGKRIKYLEIQTHEDDYFREDDELRVGFTDGQTIKIFDDGRSCCEERYMRTDDDLTTFIGADFRGARVEDGPDIEDDYDKHECQFLLVDTSLGTFTIANHNKHNGYYGGFAISAELVEP